MSYDPIAAELQRDLAGVKADLQVVERLYSAAITDVVARDKQLEAAAAEIRRITEHRDRLLAEKEVAWGLVLAPDVQTPPRAITKAEEVLDYFSGMRTTDLSLIERDACALAAVVLLTARRAAEADLPALNYLSTTEEGGE